MLNGSPKRAAKSGSKAKFAKMAAAWTEGLLDPEDPATPERRPKPTRIQGKKEFMSPPRRFAMKARPVAKIPMKAKPVAKSPMKAKGVIKKTAMKTTSAKSCKKGGRKIAMKLVVKPATKGVRSGTQASPTSKASVHHPLRPDPPRRPPADPPDLSPPSRHPSDSPIRHSPPSARLPGPDDRPHPARPTGSRPTATSRPSDRPCPAPARPFPPCSPAPVRPSSAPGLSAWVLLRPPSPSQKGGFVVSKKDRTKDGLFRRNFSQLPQSIRDEYPKATLGAERRLVNEVVAKDGHSGQWYINVKAAILKELQGKYVDVRQDNGVVTKPAGLAAALWGGWPGLEEAIKRGGIWTVTNEGKT